ncbi:MAG: dUTP diphosphatase [Proteobacteria bacterium]|nr:dUTP diphosphatase [Pseudomonadota bacterium]
MIRFKVGHPDDQCLLPVYATPLSAAADLKSSSNYILAPGAQEKVATGVYIAAVDTTSIPDNMIGSLEIRARSGLAYKHGITLTNGVGTIDSDYRDEICVLLWNTSTKPFTIHRGDRIAQMCLQLMPRLDLTVVKQERLGGFGSTGTD